jgi:hypothetical protein
MTYLMHDSYYDAYEIADTLEAIAYPFWKHTVWPAPTIHNRVQVYNMFQTTSKKLDFPRFLVIWPDAIMDLIPDRITLLRYVKPIFEAPDKIGRPSIFGLTVLGNRERLRLAREVSKSQGKF